MKSAPTKSNSENVRFNTKINNFFLRETKKESCNLLQNNKNNDHVFINNKSQCLLSAPHSVSQTRLGKHKVAEIGTLPFSLALSKLNNLSLIFKSKNNCDDANFDEISAYKNRIIKEIKTNDINYFIDIHGLAKWRNCDVNLGINFGKNIATDTRIFDNLIKELQNNNFVVAIDNPFCAGPQTLSGDIKNKFTNTWTLQIEINCSITNEIKNKEKLKILICVFDKFIKDIINKN